MTLSISLSNTSDSCKRIMGRSAESSGDGEAMGHGSAWTTYLCAVLVHSGSLSVVQPGIVEHEPDIVHIFPWVSVLAGVQFALDGGQIHGLFHYVIVVLLEEEQGIGGSRIKGKMAPRGKREGGALTGICRTRASTGCRNGRDSGS